ncbi:MAG: N-formylglutamate deformylase [Pseudomonadota bacterium]
MNPVEVIRGASPVILAVPHAGLHVPSDIEAHFNETGRTLADTDWHVDRLYEDLMAEATIVRATFHRYVIDANRDPSGKSLYPGQNTTGLCPLTDFFGASIYDYGYAPDEAEIERRRLAFHAPYHAALEAEIGRVRDHFGAAILYDCHSIRSEIPFLFEGTLPDFNIGTNDGDTCAPEIEQTVFDICKSAVTYTSVLNGRFKGGWTTRQYGRPERGVHAIQMELAQSTYMLEKAPWTYDPDKAADIRVYLEKILNALSDVARKLVARN